MKSIDDLVVRLDEDYLIVNCIVVEWSFFDEILK